MIITVYQWPLAFNIYEMSEVGISKTNLAALPLSREATLHTFSWFIEPGTILCMRPTNERWHCNVTSSLIGWVQTQNNPCWSHIPRRANASITYPITWIPPLVTHRESICLSQILEQYTVINFRYNYLQKTVQYRMTLQQFGSFFQMNFLKWK